MRRGSFLHAISALDIEHLWTSLTTAALLAVAVTMTVMAVALLAAVTLAVCALLLAGDDDLLGKRVELGDLLLGQHGEDSLGGLGMSGATLLGNLLALVGKLHRVSALALDVLDSNKAVALGLAHHVLELAAVEAERIDQIARNGLAALAMEHLEERALTLLVALRAVLVEGTVGELARLTQLLERLSSSRHDSLFPLRGAPLSEYAASIRLCFSARPL